MFNPFVEQKARNTVTLPKIDAITINARCISNPPGNCVIAMSFPNR